MTASALFVLCCCQAPSTGSRAQPLIGGAIDLADEAVAAITTGEAPITCTATLVSPRVVVTAAHCVDVLGGEAATVFFGTDAAGHGFSLDIVDSEQHPEWRGSITGGLENDYDLAVMLLERAHPNRFLPVEMSTTTAEDFLGMPYRHVGFGIFDRVSSEADGRKRSGDTFVDNVQFDVILSGTDDVSICLGDSGGPGFVLREGREQLVGVVSFTSGEGCFAPNGDVSVERYLDTFVQPFIDTRDSTCSADGLCAPIGCTSDPDCQACDADGTCTEGCDPPDLDCAETPAGDPCVTHRQCASGRCLPYLDDPGYHFCTLSCDPEEDSCPDGMFCGEVVPYGPICTFDEAPAGLLGASCERDSQCGSYYCRDGQCVLPCDTAIGYDCPMDYDCAGASDEEYCVPEPLGDSGCAAGGSRAGASLPWLGLALWLASRARPRKRRLRPSR